MTEGERDLGSLLGRANLLRLRSQWEEAAALCGDALRLDPRSAAAHALLGEIHEAQGHTDDALHCFGMAVDLAPENAAWREKLQRLAKAKSSSLRKARRSTRPAREEGQGWIARTLPTGQNRGALIAAIVLGGVVALGLGVGVGLTLTQQRDDLPRPILPPDDRRARPSEPIQVATPAPAPATPAPRSPAPVPPSPAPLTVPGAQDARFDPVTGVVTADAVLAPPAGSVAQQREEVRHTAAALARNALQAAPQARGVLVRVGFPSATGATEPVFIGEAVADTLRATPDAAFASERWGARLEAPTGR